MTVNTSASDVAHQIGVAAESDNPSPPAISRLEQLLVRVVALEFFLVAAVCYITSAVYYETFLAKSPPIEQYVPAALLIAFLVLLTALGFKHYVGIQVKSRDWFMWSGIGAVALAFSLFLSLLFVLKIADWYSRGTFFFQCIGTGIVVLVARASTHTRIRRAISSGAVEARRAVLVGDPTESPYILNNLREFGIHTLGTFP